MNKKGQPQYFSDCFNVDKALLKELGVFNPILNFDTKVFVEPLLLKKSSNDIIQGASKVFDKFFIDLLTLLKISKQEDDKPWRQAKRIVHFPEYKYTCIGYGADSIDGSGSGAELNDKILQSAKEIVDFAKDDPSIFLILPLLEEGVGADIISDMTQNIIDQNICEFTVSTMQKLELKGNIFHKARNKAVYSLLKNPFSKCPIKLLPSDILSNLPVADSFEEWLEKVSDTNSDLRDSINKHIGDSWLDETKTKRKETLLDLLKTDKSFFMEVLEALKNHDFQHYDIEEDWQGLHRWLKDSEKFIKLRPSNKVGFLNDNLDELFLAVGEIIEHFRCSIENEELWRIFWTEQHSELTHVKEFYSQMLFYMVANSWVSSKDNNLTLARSFDKKAKILEFKFSVLGKYSVNIQVKHSNNYNGLRKGYEKKTDQNISRLREKDYYLVMNFDDSESKQLKEIKKAEKEGFKIVEINVSNQENINQPFDYKVVDFEFNNTFVEFEKSSRNPYKKGGDKRHELTNNIKASIIKPMFDNHGLIKSTSIQQRANKIIELILGAFNDEENKDQLSDFAKKYDIDYQVLNDSKSYFLAEDKSRTVYEWCLSLNKETNIRSAS